MRKILTALTITAALAITAATSSADPAPAGPQQSKPKCPPECGGWSY